MSVPIVVVVGAGALHASGPYAEKPPLTKGLFEGRVAHGLLRTYVLANHAGRTTEREMRSDETVAFERAVLSLREHGAPHRRQMSLALPPYLQALMLSYSSALHADAARYSVLIDELLTLDTRVYFVSQAAAAGDLVHERECAGDRGALAGAGVPSWSRFTVPDTGRRFGGRAWEVGTPYFGFVLAAGGGTTKVRRIDRAAAAEEVPVAAAVRHYARQPRAKARSDTVSRWVPQFCET